MAKRKEGVQERILQCAKEEFLTHGYAEGSLRTIAAKAETNTNAIYVRFGDKEGLYAAIVDPCIKGFMHLFITSLESFQELDSQEQSMQREDYSSRSINVLIDYVYDHLDEFRLLTDSSYGKRFENFVHDVAQIETESTFSYLQQSGIPVKADPKMRETFLHLLMTGYFDAWFEPIRHGMDREGAKAFIALLNQYHSAGVAAGM